jgi:hypothetical protein
MDYKSIQSIDGKKHNSLRRCGVATNKERKKRDIAIL